MHLSHGGVWIFSVATHSCHFGKILAELSSRLFIYEFCLFCGLVLCLGERAS